MKKEAVTSDKLPKPFGNYSTAVIKDNFMFLSGQGPFDKNQNLVGDDIETQTDFTMRNIKCLLEDNGYTMDDVVSCTVFLNDIADWSKFNEVYGRYFTNPMPARTVVGCQLNGFLVEIQCIAMK